MKKILIIMFMCLLCFGCTKTEKNITINIYENGEEEKSIDTFVSEDTNSEQVEVKQNSEDILSKAQNITESIINEKVNNTNTDNIINESDTSIVSNDTTETDDNSILDTVKDKTVSTYNSAKTWYNENKDELKATNDEIIESDKNTINGIIDKTQTWYNENKDTITSTVTDIYESDKQTIMDFYNKITN